MPPPLPSSASTFCAVLGGSGRRNWKPGMRIRSPVREKPANPMTPPNVQGATSVRPATEGNDPLSLRALRSGCSTPERESDLSDSSTLGCSSVIRITFWHWATGILSSKGLPPCRRDPNESPCSKAFIVQGLSLAFTHSGLRVFLFPLFREVGTQVRQGPMVPMRHEPEPAISHHL